jgi:hypothetical protein
VLDSRRGKRAKRDVLRGQQQKQTRNRKEFVRIAKEFGKDIANSEQVQKLAEHFTRDVRLQVQHLGPGEEFIKPAVSLAVATAQSGERKVAVSVYVDMGLKAVIAYRSLLTPESIGQLLEAILDMLREPENMLANKVLMINGITGLADTLTKEQVEQVFLTLQPMATGAVVGLDVTGAFGDPNHPLNPFKMNLGDPATVQGGALFALSSVEAFIPGVYGERLMELIEEVMANPNPEVRGLAFMAARKMPVLSESALMRTLLATRDDVPDVVEEALLTLNTHLRDATEFWDSLAYSLRMAAQSQHTNVRRAAAFTIRSLTGKCASESVANQMKDLEKLLLADASHTVRKELSSS